MVINYNKLHADPKQGKTLDLSQYHVFLCLIHLICENL